MITTCEFLEPKIILKEPENPYYSLVTPFNTNQNYQFSKMNCNSDVATTSIIEIATSSFPSIENGFTYGELVTTFFLTIITTIMVIKILFKK